MKEPVFIDLNVAEDLVPISRLGAASKYVREVLQSGRPKVVTQAGVGVAVILDVATYEALKAENNAGALLRDLQTAIAEADAGELVSHDQVSQQVRARFAGRTTVHS